MIVLSAVYWIKTINNNSLGKQATGTPRIFAGNAKSGYKISELTSNQIFGAPVADASVNPSSLPVSTLNLKLTGVISSEHGGFAMISVNGQPQTPFFAGEKIYQNTVLDSVLPDRVVLLRGNVRETLLLDPENANAPSLIK